MPKKRLTTNGNVFRRTDGRWQSVIWYFDEQGEKKRKVFSSKTKTEAQQKITNYIAQFNEEVRNSDESQKTLKDSLTRWLQVFKFPSVERTTYDRLECTAQHQVFPLIGEKIVGDIGPESRPEPLDGAGLCLHHGEEGAHTLERILSLPYRGRFYPEEPHAIRGDDEESQFPGGTGQRVCAGARGCDRVYPHRDCQVQAGSFLYLCYCWASSTATSTWNGGFSTWSVA